MEDLHSFITPVGKMGLEGRYGKVRELVIFMEGKERPNYKVMEGLNER